MSNLTCQYKTHKCRHRAPTRPAQSRILYLNTLAKPHLTLVGSILANGQARGHLLAWDILGVDDRIVVRVLTRTGIV